MRNKITRSLFVFLLVLSLSSLFIAYVIADDDVIKIKPKQIKGAIQGSNAVQVSKDSYVSFCLHGNNFQLPYTVSSIRVTIKGKTYPAKQFFTNINSGLSNWDWILPGLHAVSFNDFSGGSSQPSADAVGLVVVARFSPDFKRVILQAAKFDAKGNRKGENINLPDISVPGFTFRNAYVTAAKGQDSIGIAIAVSTFTNSLRSRVFFMEIDFDGNVIRDQTQMKILNDGILQDIKVGVPFYNGKNWWLPADSVNYKILNFSEVAVGHNLVVISATAKGNTYTSKTVKFSEDKQQAVKRTFAGYQFYKYQKPKKSIVAPSAKPKYYLFYQHKEMTEGATLNYDPDYFIQETKKGKTKGGRIEAEIPDWKPSMKVIPSGMDYRYSSATVSNLVITSKGNILLGIARLLENYVYSTASDKVSGPSVPDKAEYQNILFRLDNKGTVLESGKGTFDTDHYGIENCPPILAPFVQYDLLGAIFFSMHPASETWMWMSGIGLVP